MVKYEDIKQNRSYWGEMSDTELDEYKKLIFNYYRQEGFPYYPTDENYRHKELNKLLEYDYSNIIEDGIIKQTMHGLGLAWSYFPHSFDVKCNDKMTPLEVFNDDEHFKRVIHRRLRMGTFITDAGIRKMLKMYTGTQAVSNFRPTAAAAIYDKYAPNGKVWDMSGGWGGRMLGAMMSSVTHYIATEPSTLTYSGLQELSELRFNWLFDKKPYTQIHTIKKGSEEFMTPSGYVDLCFTSPPYFDLEKYSDEDSQSYVKYCTPTTWINGFLRDTMYNCRFSLKRGGYMLINIADSKKSKISLEKATVEEAEKLGFKHVDTLKLALSNPNMKNRTTAFKYEPIFVFQK